MLIGSTNSQKLDIVLNEAKLMGLIDKIGSSLKEKIKEKKENGAFTQSGRSAGY